MENGEYWQLRASEMRAQASHVKDPFISGGFLALAAQYDQLATGEARSLRAEHGTPQSDKLPGRERALYDDVLRT